MEQLQLHYTSDDDQDPGEVPSFEDDPPGASRGNDDQDSGDVPSFEDQKFQMHLLLQKSILLIRLNLMKLQLFLWSTLVRI